MKVEGIIQICTIWDTLGTGAKAALVDIGNGTVEGKIPQNTINNIINKFLRDLTKSKDRELSKDSRQMSQMIKDEYLNSPIAAVPNKNTKKEKDENIDTLLNDEVKAKKNK